jgi:hypothetical protein
MLNASIPAGVGPRESWFELLDQRRFIVGNRRLTAQVTGVHVTGFDTWIQIEFEEDSRRSLLLRLAPGTSVGAAVELINSRLQLPQQQRD